MQFRENIKAMYSLTVSGKIIFSIFFVSDLFDLPTLSHSLSSVLNVFQKPTIGYKGLMTGYQNKVIHLAGEQQKGEVQLVVNLFQSVLDGFIRGEIKKEEAEPAKVRHSESQNHLGPIKSNRNQVLTPLLFLFSLSKLERRGGKKTKV